MFQVLRAAEVTDTTWWRSSTKRSRRAHIDHDGDEVMDRAGKINVELLISLVSEHKELYDKRNSDYKTFDKRVGFDGSKFHFT